MSRSWSPRQAPVARPNLTWVTSPASIRTNTSVGKTKKRTPRGVHPRDVLDHDGDPVHGVACHAVSVAGVAPPALARFG